MISGCASGVLIVLEGWADCGIGGDNSRTPGGELHWCIVWSVICLPTYLTSLNAIVNLSFHEGRHYGDEGSQFCLLHFGLFYVFA